MRGGTEELAGDLLFSAFAFLKLVLMGDEPLSLPEFKLKKQHLPNYRVDNFDVSLLFRAK